RQLSFQAEDVIGLTDVVGVFFRARRITIKVCKTVFVARFRGKRNKIAEGFAEQGYARRSAGRILLVNGTLTRTAMEGVRPDQLVAVSSGIHEPLQIGRRVVAVSRTKIAPENIGRIFLLQLQRSDRGID